MELGDKIALSIVILGYSLAFWFAHRVTSKLRTRNDILELNNEYLREKILIQKQALQLKDNRISKLEKDVELRESMIKTQENLLKEKTV